jgi:hypothetical protein
MNRSVQYELSGDSMQGGSELIGSLRDNGDMGRPKNFSREGVLEKTLLRNVHPECRHRSRTCESTLEERSPQPRRLRPALHRKSDLVERIRLKAPLNELRPEGFYGPSPVGYTDYSSLTQSQIDAHREHHPVDPHGLPERRSKEVTCLFNFTSLRLLHRTA